MFRKRTVTSTGQQMTIREKVRGIIGDSVPVLYLWGNAEAATTHCSLVFRDSLLVPLL